METPRPPGTNHSHVTSAGASMKITPSQWPVILISALGKSSCGSAGKAQYEQTKRNAWHSEGATEGKREGETDPKKKLGRKEASELLVLSDIPLCSHNVCFLFVRGCFELKQAWATIIGSSHLVWFVETAHQFSVSNSNTSKHFEAILERWTQSSGICIRWKLLPLLQSFPDLLYSLQCLLF